MVDYTKMPWNNSIDGTDAWAVTTSTWGQRIRFRDRFKLSKLQLKRKFLSLKRAKQEAAASESTNQPHDGTINSWIRTTCDWTTIHGPVWYNRIDNRATKAATIILALVSCIGLPIFLSIELVLFSQNVEVLTSGLKLSALLLLPQP